MTKYLFACLFKALVSGCTSNPHRPTKDDDRRAALREFYLLQFVRER